MRIKFNTQLFSLFKLIEIVPKPNFSCIFIANGLSFKLKIIDIVGYLNILLFEILFLGILIEPSPSINPVK